MTKDDANDAEPKKEKAKSQSKKKKQVIEESSSEDEEPKTYEINETSVPEATYEDLRVNFTIDS